MEDRNRFIRMGSILLFFIGFILGLTFNILAIWADLEAFLFDTPVGSEGQVTTLSCPILITNSEEGKVTASITNPTERTVTRLVRTRISFGFVTLMREEEVRLELAPGETRDLEWYVTSDDAAWRRFVLVRVHALRSAPLPYQSSSCGIVTMNIPFASGNQIVASVLGISLFSLVTGVGLWVKQHRPITEKTRPLAVLLFSLTGFIIGGFVANLMGWWLVALALLFFTLIIAIAAFTHFSSSG
jgi:hypothetical protein